MEHAWLLTYFGPASEDPGDNVWMKIWRCRHCAVSQSGVFELDKGIEGARAISPEKISECVSRAQQRLI